MYHVGPWLGVINCLTRITLRIRRTTVCKFLDKRRRTFSVASAISPFRLASHFFFPALLMVLRLRSNLSPYFDFARVILVISTSALALSIFLAMMATVYVIWANINRFAVARTRNSPCNTGVLLMVVIIAFVPRIFCSGLRHRAFKLLHRSWWPIRMLASCPC